MSNTKITIDNTLAKAEKWYNLEFEGKKISINVPSNPKTIKSIDDGAIEVEINLVEKEGKYYGWDVKEQKQGGGGGNKFQLSPEQLAAKQAREDHTQRMIVAQSCYAATCNLKQQSSVTHADVLKMTETAYNFIMELSK